MQTIPEVVARLEAIINDCATRDCRSGYFAVLYHRVTKRVGDCVLRGDFEDCARMERVDVIFAKRYIDAYDAWRAGQPCSESWRIAFEGTDKRAPLILQHLLLGMNAHINLDLGIAAADAMEGYTLEEVHQDFLAINQVLADLLDEVEIALAKANPLMKLLFLQWHKYDDMLVNFSMKIARSGAWEFAETVAGKMGGSRDGCIAARDVVIATLGETVVRPRSWLLRATIQLVRLFEKRKTADVIKILGT